MRYSSVCSFHFARMIVIGLLALSSICSAADRPNVLFLFADELLRVSRQVAEVKGANHRLLLDRLWLLWADAGRA